MNSAMVILGLGSNKGDRTATLASTIKRLTPHIKNIQSSRIYETQALLPEGAPASWDIPFLNMAILGETTLSPAALLQQLKQIEIDLGRKPAERWAPREIDIDILAMDQLIYEQPGLRIPHAGLLERDFVLLPLVELAPEWRYPQAGAYCGWKAADILAHKGYSAGSLQEEGIAVYA